MRPAKDWVSFRLERKQGSERERRPTEGVEDSPSLALFLLVQPTKLRHHKLHRALTNQPIHKRLHRDPLLLCRLLIRILIVVLQTFRVDPLLEYFNDGDGDVGVLVREEVGESCGRGVFEEEGVGQGGGGGEKEKGVEGFEEVELRVDESTECRVA